MQTYIIPKHNIAVVNGDICINNACICFADYVHKLDLKKSSQYKLRNIFTSCIKQSFAAAIADVNDHCTHNSTSVYKIIFFINLKCVNELVIYEFFKQRAIKNTISKLLHSLNCKEYSSYFVEVEDKLFEAEFEGVQTLTNPKGYLLDQITVITSKYL
jgi:hypothetical protein